MDELPLACTLGLECGPSFALFFKLGKSAKNPLLQDHLRHQEYQLESAKVRMNSVLGENLEDQHFALHHQELECRRAAP